MQYPCTEFGSKTPLRKGRCKVIHAINLQEEAFESVNMGMQRVIYQLQSTEVGDTVRAHEHDAESGLYSGRWVDLLVTHFEKRLKVASVQVVGRGCDRAYFMSVSGRQIAA